MKKVLLFVQHTCPHCQKAFRFMEELRAEHPAYRDIDVTVIDETEQPELADTYDYYFVPTYFVDGQKLHDGFISKENVRTVLDAALS